MRGRKPLVKCLLLLLQRLCASEIRRGIRDVGNGPDGVTLWSRLSAPVNQSRIPDYEITWFGGDFVRSEALIFKPSNVVLGEGVKVFTPPVRLGGVIGKEVLNHVVSPGVNGETAIFRTRPGEAGNTLNTLETLTVGRLINVSLRLSWDMSRSPRQRDVQRIKGNKQLPGPPDLLKNVNNTWFKSDIPHKLFMHNAIVSESVEVGNVWEIVRGPGRPVGKVEGVVVKGLEPVESGSLVGEGFLFGDDVGDDGVAVVEVVLIPICHDEWVQVEVSTVNEMEQ